MNQYWKPIDQGDMFLAVEAIKDYRYQYGVGLITARNAVLTARKIHYGY